MMHKDTPLPLFPEEIVIKLKKMIKLIEKTHAEMSGDITHSQGRIVFPIIKNRKGYTIQELAEIAGVSKGLVSRTVANLEAKGLVQRDKVSENQDRNYKIVLSANAEECIAKRKLRMQEISGKWKEKVTHEDILVFIKVLDVFTS